MQKLGVENNLELGTLYVDVDGVNSPLLSHHRHLYRGRPADYRHKMYEICIREIYETKTNKEKTIPRQDSGKAQLWMKEKTKAVDCYS